jgi:hypothetical protein
MAGRPHLPALRQHNPGARGAFVRQSIFSATFRRQQRQRARAMGDVLINVLWGMPVFALMTCASYRLINYRLF